MISASIDKPQESPCDPYFDPNTSVITCPFDHYISAGGTLSEHSVPPPVPTRDARRYPPLKRSTSIRRRHSATEEFPSFVNEPSTDLAASRDAVDPAANPPPVNPDFDSVYSLQTTGVYSGLSAFSTSTNSEEYEVSKLSVRVSPTKQRPHAEIWSERIKDLRAMILKEYDLQSEASVDWGRKALDLDAEASAQHYRLALGIESGEDECRLSPNLANDAKPLDIERTSNVNSSNEYRNNVTSLNHQFIESLKRNSTNRSSSGSVLASVVRAHATTKKHIAGFSISSGNEEAKSRPINIKISESNNDKTLHMRSAPTLRYSPKSDVQQLTKQIMHPTSSGWTNTDLWSNKPIITSQDPNTSTRGFKGKLRTLFRRKARPELSTGDDSPLLRKHGKEAGSGSELLALAIPGKQEIVEVRHSGHVVFILEHDSSEKCIKVQAGTLGCILGELTSPALNETVDTQRCYQKLITHSVLFLADVDLLGLLEHEFRRATDSHRRYRILGTLQTWLAEQPEDALHWNQNTFDTIFDSTKDIGDEIADQCRKLSFELSAIHSNEKKHESYLQKSSRRIDLKLELDQAVTRVEQNRSEIDWIYDVGADHLAQYLAALDLIFFREAVRPKQLRLKLKDATPDGPSDRVKDPLRRGMITRANRLEKREKMLRHWVQYECMLSGGRHQRARLMKFFVNVAKALLHYGDFQGATTIVNALLTHNLSKTCFPQTWKILDAEGVAGDLRCLQYAVEEGYDSALRTANDPVVPIWTGPKGILRKITEEYDSPSHRIRETLNVVKGKGIVSTTFPSEFPYPAIRGDLPSPHHLHDLSKYARLWQVVLDARARIQTCHTFGTLGRDAYALHIFEPAAHITLPVREGTFRVNRFLGSLSEGVEKAILRAWMVRAGAVMSEAHTRRFVLDYLYNNAACAEAEEPQDEEENGWPRQQRHLMI
ncbi:MAG: hypothetical protein M1837_005163 [Sclerophora amabilis]|nr:MAG: hypothetical protein M1837_005163 [Sclerophora amabilis]